MFICDLIKVLNFLDEKYQCDLTVISIDLWGNILLSNGEIFYVLDVVEFIDSSKKKRRKRVSID